MNHPKTLNELYKIQLDNFERPIILLFLSDSLEESKKFEELLPNIEEDMEDIDLCLVVIKDTEEFSSVFHNFTIEEVP